MKINLGDVEETLAIPLWGQAKLTQEYPSLLNEKKTVELVEQIEYDSSTLDKNEFKYNRFASFRKPKYPPFIPFLCWCMR